MTYRVEFTRSAIKALRRVNPADTGRLRGAIAMLAEDPRPPASRPLRGRDGWRLRVGEYLVLYTIRDDVLLIVVVAVAHMSSAYR
jgi:mRNA interferase RelE/StbE